MVCKWAKMTGFSGWSLTDIAKGAGGVWAVFCNFLFVFLEGHVFMRVHDACLQGSYGHGKPGKVMELKNGHFQAWKSQGKNLNHKSFGKVMEICYNHIIYAEFEIINMLFKERRSKY